MAEKTAGQEQGSESRIKQRRRPFQRLNITTVGSAELTRRVSPVVDRDEETPPKLRELEKGWRAKRRAVLGEQSDNASPIVEPKRQRNVLEFKRPLLTTIPLVSTTQYTAKARAARVSRASSPMPGPDEPSLSLCRRKPPPSVPSPLPTPPPTPPISELSKRPSRTARPFKASSPTPKPAESEKDTLQPILASPLPPTSSPVPLVRGRPETIDLHPPASKHSFSLRTKDILIKVLRDGKSLQVLRWVDRRWSLVKNLRYGEKEKFDRDDVAQWRIVQQLVEKLKRETPRVGVAFSPKAGSLTEALADIAILGQDLDLVRPAECQLRVSTRYHSNVLRDSYA